MLDKVQILEKVTERTMEKEMKADRFDEAMMGIKKAYRPDYLDSENTLFINKLNFVTKHFEDTYR